ncbi:SMC-Scp complex subunit ScpB [Parasegetibacter sp. NRK P23]|uniref:SMC-Scp complex subunit ScpB n=1 Tax=Parasegetibacter sp. NRK P23 TaxID=2942999 RepID=UPI002043A95D|nr:SMC-Scp complex subunit ScpB [Parasegetibacter sp. NRK P23]MCM5529126.1 SMC-Scp complex subunit ScpB [Parasegetibacter sp. NRK P23]
MEIGHIIPHIEALIFASEKPLTSPEITDLVNNAFGFMEDKITIEQVETSLEGIVEKYNAEFYPFEVRESGGGWQFLTKKDFHKTVAQLNGDKFMKKLSAAAMETLAIVAYKQPITKSEIEAIRGVSSDYAIQKLLEKDLVIISGRNEDMPGKPLLYSTSKSFMDYFGINSADELPKIKEVLAEQMVEPTVVMGENTASDTVETAEETAVEATEEHAADAETPSGENDTAILVIEEEIIVDMATSDIAVDEDGEAELTLEDASEEDATETEELSIEDEISDEDNTSEDDASETDPAAPDADKSAQ